MAVIGPNNPGTAVDNSSIGTLTWSVPSNIVSSNNLYATFTTNTVNNSHYLKATNFGFSVPSGATINGITVEIERKASHSLTTRRINDNIVRLVVGGVVSGNNYAVVTNWPTTEAYFSYGGSSDLWGLSLTDTDINDSTFGVVLSVTTTASGKIIVSPSVDHIRITVTYTSGGGGGSTINPILLAGD